MTNFNVDDILQLEIAVWQALEAGDAQVDASLLAEDFHGVYGTGFAGKADHVSQLRGGPAVARFALSEARLLVLAENVVLLSYRAEWARHPRRAPEAVETMYVSSIWRRNGLKWENVFSQDTNAT